MTDSLLAHGLKSRQESRETPYLTRADYKSVLMIKQGGALPIARRPATISLARTRRGGAGAGLRRQQAAQRAGVPARQFSDKLLKQFKLVYSPAGDPILTRWAARMPEVGGPRHLVVIALEDLLELLEKEKSASGYPCVKKMFNKLYNLYPTEVMGTSGRAETWFGLEGFDREGIEIYLKECRVRADLRPLLPSEQPAPHPIVIHHAFEQMQADLLDLGAGRDKYFRYVLVAVELFTRHAWLFPLPTKEGVLVARAMYMLWMDTQRPARFQTDNGTEFCNDLLEALCSLCGVKHITSSVGNPQSQGATERLNRTLKDRLRALLIDASTHSWPYQLMQVQKIINNEPCEALGGRMSRTMALFGAPEPAAGLPSAAAISELLQFESGSGSAAAGAGSASGEAGEPDSDLPPHLAGVRAAVGAAHGVNQRRIANVRCKKGEPKQFAVGDLVLFKPRSMGKVGSTIDRNRIPCRVVAVNGKFGRITYQLRCNAGVLEENVSPGLLTKAPASVAADLTFDGVETEGVRTVTVKAARQAQAVGGIYCLCRGQCSNRCPCKQQGALCSRSCGCKTCKGGKCGNY